ncbi:AraC family transcriptional regulator [Nocardioides sp. P86]|uniref:AraC family transcriptional regulator n=1 Tax=Nocardioides sp. P86 TaxID=2939569 RepID=UPI0020409624|nr:AraC family transcriptional regulator [Nocardioides sp. P86]MCM3515600.1 AraC family transcriptional regulator [Nocardioides sp. P86]
MIPDNLPAPAAADWDFPRSALGVALLVRHAVRAGLAPEAALAGTGLAVDHLEAPGAVVTAAQELRVVRTLQRHRPGSGAEVGASYDASTFGVLGLALLSSRTVRDAVEVALRYVDLSHAFAIPRAGLVDGRLVVDLDGSGLPADVRAFLLARDATAVDTVLASLVPGGVGARLSLGADRARLEVDAAELDRPLPRPTGRAAAQVDRLAEQLCLQAVARRRERTGVAQEVRVLITQRLAAGAPMPEVASALGLSERTLRRRLGAAGTTYRELLEEVRAPLAAELLGAGLPVAEVARRLGYAETAALTHAHRRWTGGPPSSARREHPAFTQRSPRPHLQAPSRTT